MTTRFVLVRHAAIDNGERLCGTLDLELSSAGRAQLHALLERRPRASAPSALLTSPLKRAAEVAWGLARVWGLQPAAADWAREIHCGDMEGMLLERVKREFPDLWGRNEAQVEDAFAWPGGETYAQFRDRVLTGLDSAATRCAGGRAVIVTHAGVISQVLGAVKGRPACVWQADRPRPLTATEVLWEHGAPRAVLSFDDPEWY